MSTASTAPATMRRNERLGCVRYVPCSKIVTENWRQEFVDGDFVVELTALQDTKACPQQERVDLLLHRGFVDAPVVVPGGTRRHKGTHTKYQLRKNGMANPQGLEIALKQPQMLGTRQAAER